jgi:NAD(P)-dependent dehydrogenase (short-subunit alcohol dehydrogenase family)
VNLAGKTVLITGANSGIGKETARYMAKRGARVIMACRTMETAKIVRGKLFVFLLKSLFFVQHSSFCQFVMFYSSDKIAAESENSEIILHHLDLSSFQSVREFCANVIETEPKIDILIHNAGYGGILSKAVSVDGIEYTMATNHYGPFLMTNLLIDLLKKSAPCRIVVVGSKAHTLSFLDPTIQDHLNPVEFWPPFILYANSKLANLLFTFELARRLEGSGITVNALHPGTVNSKIWRNYRFPLRIFPRIFKRFLRTVEEGMQTIAYVSLSQELEKVSGKYFRNCRLGKVHKKASNADWQRKFWEESEILVQMTKDDPYIKRQ